MSDLSYTYLLDEEEPEKFTLEKIDEIIKRRTADFVEEISAVVLQGESYMEALVEYSERNDIEIEVLGEIVKSTPSLLLQLTKEAEINNLLPKTNRLEF